jgi:N-acetylmuramoyl-L-alanine amidase CwlA
MPVNLKWKEIVNKSFSPVAFDAYCNTLQWENWKPSFIVLHNTGVPSLAQRPDGLTEQHIQNLVSYYRDTKHWSAGPHLFVDDRQIWVFTPLTTPGVHSPSWNNASLGIEMLGNYETESFSEGRGLQVRQNAVAAIASLSKVLHLTPELLHFHKQDPATTHKDCPGKNVVWQEVVAEVREHLSDFAVGEHSFSDNIYKDMQNS